MGFWATFQGPYCKHSIAGIIEKYKDKIELVLGQSVKKAVCEMKINKVESVCQELKLRVVTN